MAFTKKLSRLLHNSPSTLIYSSSPKPGFNHPTSSTLTGNNITPTASNPHPSARHPHTLPLSPSIIGSRDSYGHSAMVILNTIICGDLNGRLMETLSDTMTNTCGRLMKDWLQLNDILLWNELLAKGQPAVTRQFKAISHWVPITNSSTSPSAPKVASDPQEVPWIKSFASPSSAASTGSRTRPAPP
ncbi:hypothetical protein [Absidia glauca]|uniref:Endonuclease/exonuclease/phosphatase domain-containing protein n=1 Tax=Absidia glauca TaxID=4829 RepID=A0A163K3J4_ABSGL|nr:hypothetical protein [Absidia glauca]